MRRSVLLLPLAALLACRPPVAAPTFEQHLAEAAGRRVEQGRALSLGDPEAYRQGFLNGARMVEAASLAGRRPFALQIGLKGGSPLPAQKLPEGAEVIDETPLEVEVDPLTGLEIFRLAPEGGPGFNQGQVDGFQWAFERRRGDLVRPLPEPQAAGGWTLLSKEHQTRISGGQGDVDLTWFPGGLAWTRHEKGFPGLRRWRPAPAWMTPQAAALGDGVLWIDTERGALALDLDSGAIRSVKPRPVIRDLEVMDLDQIHTDLEAEARKARPGLLERAGRGETAAMVELGFNSDEPAERTQWFRKAANLGDSKGMYEYAIRCFQGAGVPEDKAEARRWFAKAAKAGHEGATQALAGLFPES